MTNKQNEKIFLSKEAAVTIAKYLQICYLWVPPEDSGSDEEELQEIRKITKKLQIFGKKESQHSKKKQKQSL